MLNSQLIMIEGIPGSGKSTMAKRVYEYLCSKGINSSLHSEGDARHPIDLAWHAYLSKPEFGKLITKYNLHTDMINQYSVIENDYVLVQYRDINSTYFDGGLLEWLKSKEVCYSSTPSVPFKEFTQVFCNRWRKFAKNDVVQNKVSIFESVLFQHQIHDLLRNYTLSNSEIIEHLQDLLQQMHALNPILFYITQSDVKDSLTKIALQRNSPKFGTNEAIKYWQNRKSIEYEAMSKLPLRSYVIDNSNYDWDKVFNIIINMLDFE